jgi:hypothetical protein
MSGRRPPETVIFWCVMAFYAGALVGGIVVGLLVCR